MFMSAMREPAMGSNCWQFAASLCRCAVLAMKYEAKWPQFNYAPLNLMPLDVFKPWSVCASSAHAWRCQ